MRLNKYLKIHSLTMGEFCKMINAPAVRVWKLRKGEARELKIQRRIYEVTQGAVSCIEDILDDPPISFNIQIDEEILEFLAGRSKEAAKVLEQIRDLGAKPKGDLSFVYNASLYMRKHLH